MDSEMSDEAMVHLRNVLMLLAELHPDDRCKALDKAMAFYNDAHQDGRIEPVEGYETRLVRIGPTGASSLPDPDDIIPRGKDGRPSLGQKICGDRIPIR